MTSPVALMFDERARLGLAAVAAVVAAVLAAGEGDFAPHIVAMLPVPALAFVAKARWPQLPNLLVAIPALVVPLVVNITDTDSEFSMFLLILGWCCWRSSSPTAGWSPGSWS